MLVKGASGPNADTDKFKCIFFNEVWIKISMKFIPDSPIDDWTFDSTLVPVMGLHRTSDRPLHEPILTNIDQDH